MLRRTVAGIAVSLAVGASAALAQEIPLDVGDPTPRTVWVRFEDSVDPAAVGQSFGEPWPATWSVSAGVGRIEIDATTHGLARAAGEGLGFTPVPGSFAPFAVEIDLATLEATSPPTAGALESGPLAFGFETDALDSTGTAGFVGPFAGDLFCTSQQQIDDACSSISFFCGKTCTLVPGAPFDPLSGELHAVGAESQQGCDGAVCSGPFDVFATTGDLRIVEVPAPVVPASTLPLRAGLALLLAALGARALRRRRV